MDDKKSFDNLGKWFNDVRKYAKDPEIIVVGNKSDLTKQQDEQKVSNVEAFEFAQTIGAIKFVQCSALDGTGVTELFSDLIPEYYLSKKRGSFLGKLGSIFESK
jgi:GTPase SAR1 family protein